MKRHTCVIASLAALAALVLSAGAQQPADACRVLEGFSIQSDRDVAERLAVRMRNGMLLTAEPGVTSITHREVECKNEREVWRCFARVEVCRSASGSTTASTPEAVPQKKAPPAGKAIPKSATVAPAQTPLASTPSATPVIMTQRR